MSTERLNRRRLLQSIAAACVLAAGKASSQGESAASPRISIIVDDLGYDLGAARRTVALPGPVVCSILPHTPHAQRIAALANRADKSVFLHLPLQATDDSMSPDAPPRNPSLERLQPTADPGRQDKTAGTNRTINLDTTQAALQRAIADGLASVPHAVGVNGHRGSLLTRHPGHMAWLMQEIAARDLLFVDSYTTHLSVALKVAREHGVTATRRHVFLDNDPAPAAIEAEFFRLLRLARRQGHAVAIGHPYPTTLAVLERSLPALSASGVELVDIGTLLGRKDPPAAMSQSHGGRPPAGEVEPTGAESF